MHLLTADIILSEQPTRFNELRGLHTKATVTRRPAKATPAECNSSTTAATSAAVADKATGADKANGADKGKDAAAALKGAEQYDPARDPFWMVLGGLMLIGAVLHMRRVYGGWVEWRQCADTMGSASSLEVLNECWNHSSGGAKKSEGALWKVLHFGGGVVWMFGGLAQLVLWHYGRRNPRLMRLHRINGKVMALNAMVLVAGVGGVPAAIQALRTFTPQCTIPAIAGGVPGVLAVASAKEHLGCHPDFAFMPHFLIWSGSGVCALVVSVVKSARNPRRRAEHKAWGLFMAGFGCFDSVNYLMKHGMLYLDYFSDYNLYHFIVVPTPFVFVLLLIYKCRLHTFYRLSDIWFSFLVNHARAYLCEYWCTPSGAYADRGRATLAA